MAIFNFGTDAITWTADLVQGSEWLRLSATAGSSTLVQPGTITLSTDNTSLSSGPYYALVRVRSPQAINSPQYVTVVLNVNDATSAAVPDPSPPGLTFVAVSGQPPPPAQVLRVLASSAQGTNYQSSATADDGGNWLSVSITAGVTSTQRPGQANVSVNHAGLRPGIYRGEVLYSLSNNDVRAVSVTLTVLPAGAKLAKLPESAPRFASGCTPSRMVLSSTGLVSSFLTPARLAHANHLARGRRD